MDGIHTSSSRLSIRSCRRAAICRCASARSFRSRRSFRSAARSAQREHVARADHSRCDGVDVCDGSSAPIHYDLQTLAETLDPDILVVDRDGIGVLS